MRRRFFGGSSPAADSNSPAAVLAGASERRTTGGEVSHRRQALSPEELWTTLHVEARPQSVSLALPDSGGDSGGGALDLTMAAATASNATDKLPPHYGQMLSEAGADAATVAAMRHNITQRAERLPVLVELLSEHLAGAEQSRAAHRSALQRVEDSYAQVLGQFQSLQADTFADLSDKIDTAADFPCMVEQLLGHVRSASASVVTRLAAVDSRNAAAVAQLPLLVYALQAVERASAASETMFFAEEAVRMKLELMESELASLRARMQHFQQLQADVQQRFSRVAEQQRRFRQLLVDSEQLAAQLAQPAPLAANSPPLADVLPAAAALGGASRSTVARLAWNGSVTPVKGLTCTLLTELQSLSTSYLDERGGGTGGDDDEQAAAASKQASLGQLVARLTDPTRVDTELRADFLVAYRYFITPVNLLRLLAVRYLTPLPVGMESNRAIDKGLRPIQQAVVAFVDQWTAAEPQRFADEPNLAAAVQRYFPGRASAKKTARAHKRLLRQQKQRHEQLDVATPVFHGGAELLMASGDTHIAISAADVAQQICLVFWAVYARIDADEFFDLAWSRPALRDSCAPNIVRYTGLFNSLSELVLSAVLRGGDAATRAARVRYFADVAEECDRLNCLAGLLAIACALQRTEIARLKETLSLLPADVRQRVDDNKLVANNFRLLRQRMDNPVLPAVPFIGVYLTDLTFLVDGNPTFTKDGLVNVVKMTRVAGRVRQFLSAQAQPYPFAPLPYLQRWLTDFADNYSPADADAVSLRLASEENPRASLSLPAVDPASPRSLSPTGSRERSPSGSRSPR